MLTLEVKKRDATEKPEMLRSRGVMPAVFYGPKESATPIAIETRQFEHIWKEAGETTIIKLQGLGDEKETLIHDVQFHPVFGKPLHADFYVLEKGKKIKIKVPLLFSGVSPAEKAGHIVVKALHEIEIEVAPAELPRDLPVDITKLESVGDHIIASQIILPPSAGLITHTEEIVASVTEFKEEKVDTAFVPAEVEGAAPVEGADGAASAPATPAAVPNADASKAKK